MLDPPAPPFAALEPALSVFVLGAMGAPAAGFCSLPLAAGAVFDGALPVGVVAGLDAPVGAGACPFDAPGTAPANTGGPSTSSLPGGALQPVAASSPPMAAQAVGQARDRRDETGERFESIGFTSSALVGTERRGASDTVSHSLDGSQHATVSRHAGHGARIREITERRSSDRALRSRARPRRGNSAVTPEVSTKCAALDASVTQRTLLAVASHFSHMTTTSLAERKSVASAAALSGF
jgi:hypothetical protein